MSRNATRSFATVIGLAALSLAPVSMAGGALPSVDSPELAQGPYSSMHMLLQKTVLKINVATVDVRVDKPTQAHFAELAHGQQYSYPLDGQLASAAIAAPHAVVQMQFVRDVPLNRWIGVVSDNLELAREAGLIGHDIEQRVAGALPQWFAPLQERGYQKGDKLIYAISPETLRTVVVSAGGQVLLDLTEREAGARRVVMPSYFAPKSDTRERLIRSLLEKR